MTQYVHHIPGRLRLRNPLLKRQETDAAALSTLMESQQGVLSCTVNTTTGSILILYDEALTNVFVILGLLKKEGYVDLVSLANSPTRTPNNGMSNMGGLVVKTMATTVFEKIAQRSAAALISAVL